jgi:hypothetical protein
MAVTTALGDTWRHPLFEALLQRRSRRFARGFEIPEGPLRYASAAAPLPLSEMEEALLAAAGAGVTGSPLWGTRSPAPAAAGGLRCFSRTTPVST